MAQLTGIAVTLDTLSGENTGTDVHLYIGVIGTGGGREFPLDTADINDFEPGTEEFALGDIWEGGVITAETKFPINSSPGEDNDPAFIPLDLDRVVFVYLRKQGDNTESGDDAYRLAGLSVTLYGPAAPSRRRFSFLSFNLSPALANENGHVIYLQESVG